MGRVRTAARVDGNHALIVRQLRAIGCSVLDTHQLPNCFDILVGYRRRTFVMEIKDPAQPRAGRKLTAGEKAFRDTWQGSEYHVVETIEQAIRIVTTPVKLRETTPLPDGHPPASTLPSRPPETGLLWPVCHRCQASQPPAAPAL